MAEPIASAASTAQVPGHARRGALLRIAGLCGLALSADALAAMGALGEGKARRQPGLLAPDALALTAVLAELIIPRTDTPGARAVGAHHTISHMLKVCVSPEARQQYLAGLARLDAVARTNFGKRFVALGAARQSALLHALDGGKAPFDADGQRFFSQLKSYTTFAYYTSQEGATRELAYLPVPGGFKGNVPLKKIGRSWAL